MSQPSANKKLGQHFLSNPGIVQRIGESVEMLSQKGALRVIEVGPGPGALTQELLLRGLKVTAVEVDDRMVAHLRDKFREALEQGQLEVIHADVLKLDLSIFQGPESVVCGNLPYNVGTAIVFKFLEDLPSARSFCYMLQKEVVLRFISEPNSADYGIPTVKLGWSCEVLGHFWVKPGSFTPPPKVDSGVFWFKRLAADRIMADPSVRGQSYDQLSVLVNRAFGHRRKMLRGIFPSLKDSPQGSCRAQELSPKELLILAEKLQKEE